MTKIINKYPKYKDSGVDWLGEIPEEWKVESFKNILTERNEKNDPIRSTERLSLSIDKGITLYSEKTTNLDRFKDDFTQYKLAYKGDLVFNSMNMIVGAVGISDYFGCVSPVYYTYHGGINDYYATKFYEYLFRSRTVKGVLYSLGKGLIAIDRGDGKYNTLRLKVSREDLRSLRLPFPNIIEQTAIAKYLDNKTTKIDQAIAHKQKLILLLKERKQILIQNAVTGKVVWNKAENAWTEPIEVKDSGVEWIGDIPVDWEVKKLKYVLSERNERSILGEEPLFMMSQIHGLVVRSEYHDKAEVAQSNVGNKIVYNNDLVFNKLKAHLGVFFKSTIGFEGIVSPDYAVYYSKSLIKDLKFLELLFRHPSYINQFIIRATGIVEGLIRLYTADLFDIYVPIPPIKKQQMILEYIETQSTKIDKSIALQETQIEKLREYKQVLINSCVTGKIRVC